MVNKGARSSEYYTDHSLLINPLHKKLSVRQIGRILKYRLPDDKLVMVKVTSAMVGRTVEEVMAQVGRKKTSKITLRLPRYGMTLRPREGRPSIGSVMRFITDASSHELDTVLSNVISKPIGRTAVAKAAAVTNQSIDAPEGDYEVNSAVITAAGEMLTSQQVANRMKKTRQAVNEMLKRGAILGIRHGMHWRFPSTQFDRTAPVAGLKLLLSTLAHLDPWDALSVILAPEAPPTQRPLELLKKGERAAAIAVASRKAADFKILPSSDRIMAALSTDMAAEEAVDRAVSTLAKRSISQADV